MISGSIDKSLNKRLSSNEDHWSVLAFCRFLLALWILIAHTHNFADSHQIPLFNLNGIGAVYCFLAISGFSIHASFVSRSEGFYYRRFCRIFPVYLAALAVTAIVYAVVPDPNLGPLPTLWNWIGCFFLLQAVVPVAIGVIFPAWSLSIEAFYYAVTRTSPKPRGFGCLR